MTVLLTARLVAGAFSRCARCAAHTQYKFITSMCLQAHDLIPQASCYLHVVLFGAPTLQQSYTLHG